MFRCILFFFLLMLNAFIYANDTLMVTFQSGENATDLRFNYDRDVLQLALKKTQAQYGDFKLLAAPAMTSQRALHFAQNNAIDNFIIKLSYRQSLQHSSLSYIPFPVDRGISGYRICFSNKDSLKKLEKINSKYQLQTLSFGLLDSWLDVDILRDNGFFVQEVNSYTQLFSMLANQRFHLLCRGINEISQEFMAHRHLYDDIVIDNYISLVYPMPRFFFSHQNNQQLLKRLEQGLLLAWQDGSFIKLWQHYYQNSVTLANLSERQVIKLHNLHLQGLNEDYLQYLYAR